MSGQHGATVRPKAAAELLGIGIATLWRWAKEKPDFPPAIHLSPRCTVFQKDALIAWVDAQTTPQRDPPESDTPPSEPPRKPMATQKTLRDEMAMAALPNAFEYWMAENVECSAYVKALIAETAYEIADAMLKARQP